MCTFVTYPVIGQLHWTLVLSLVWSRLSRCQNHSSANAFFPSELKSVMEYPINFYYVALFSTRKCMQFVEVLSQYVVSLIFLYAPISTRIYSPWKLQAICTEWVSCPGKSRLVYVKANFVNRYAIKGYVTEPNKHLTNCSIQAILWTGFAVSNIKTNGCIVVPLYLQNIINIGIMFLSKI